MYKRFVNYRMSVSMLVDASVKEMWIVDRNYQDCLTSCAIRMKPIHIGVAGICDRFLPSLGQTFLVAKAMAT